MILKFNLTVTPMLQELFKSYSDVILKFKLTVTPMVQELLRCDLEV